MEIRFAERKDTSTILKFIMALAEYEHMTDQVVADEKLLEHWIFDKGKAEVLFVLEDGKEAGFALFFHSFVFSFLCCFVGVAIWNRFSPWPVAWWSRYFLVVNFGVPLAIAAITAAGGTVK